MTDPARSPAPADRTAPSTAPPPRPSADRGGNRPPTAALPPGALEDRRRRRAVAAVPPTRPLSQRTQAGVAAALVPDDVAMPRRSRQELLRIWVVVARIVALGAGVAVVPFLADPAPLLPWLFLLALGLTLVRSVRPAHTVVDQAVDVVLVAGILLVSGGMLGPFALFGAATAFSIGAIAGIPGGLLGATVLVLGGSLLGLDGPNPSEEGEQLTTVIGWVSLYPVGAVLGGLVGHVMVENRAGQALLLEANRVLASLERLATAAPETLSPARVAEAAAGQFRRVLGAEVALVLVEREGTLLEIGRSGHEGDFPHLVLDRDWESLYDGGGANRLREPELPARVQRLLPALPQWLAVPLRARGRRLGIVLVGVERYRESRAVRLALQDVATETAVALDNTQLFSRVEHAAATAERERLARDLHDGVAQQLTHVRFELELLARSAADGSGRDELQRLARVTQRATDDVRSTIRGLRAQALDEGLVSALRTLVHDLDSASGPELDLDVRGAAELDADTAAELYRIVQEALSNSLRHSSAEAITVSVTVIGDTLVVAVEDDGIGLAGAGSKDGDGLGLRTMRARAARLGADFLLDDGVDGGTRMEIRLPLHEETA